jgi:hypothetical protein
VIKTSESPLALLDVLLPTVPIASSPEVGGNKISALLPFAAQVHPVHYAPQIITVSPAKKASLIP